jgi:hypothetical protein
MSQIDSGYTKIPWGVDPYNYVYALKNGKRRRVAVNCNHASSGGSGVWFICGSRIMFRRGITKRNPIGSGNKRIPGGLKQIDSGPFGFVCGVNSGNNIYCRRGITRRRRYGSSWIRVPGKLSYISCGKYGHWGVNKAQNIYFRKGVKKNRPQGTRWQRVPGKLMQVESGPDGAVWGVGITGRVYTRLGVSRKRPTGTTWMAVGKKSLSSVSVGLGFVYGIGRKGAPVVADVAKLLGKGGLPKKPGKKQSDNPKILDRFRFNFHYHYRYL